MCPWPVNLRLGIRAGHLPTGLLAKESTLPKKKILARMTRILTRVFGVLYLPSAAAISG